MKLGKREIDALACPPGKRDRLVLDDERKGFGVRVTQAGTKIFVFQYKRDKTVRRMTLGVYGEKDGGITLDYARKLAAVARGHVAAGRDPWTMRKETLAAEAAAAAAERRRAAALTFTLDKLVDEWTVTGLLGASASHVRDAPTTIRRVFKRHLQTPVELLVTAELRRTIDEIARLHPVSARRARDYGRAALNWAISRDLATHNPFAAVRVEGGVKSRDRALSDPELGAVWRAAEKLDYPFGPCIRLLILTMQRRSEVAGMRWPELDRDFTTWTLPATRAKNRKSHIVHLPEAARVILRELHKRPRPASQTLVFTTTGKTAISGFSRAMRQLLALIKAEPPGPDGPVEWQGPWTLHDFRRTGVTTLARLGVPPHVADKLLNHVQGAISGVAAIYQRHDFLAERESAMTRWAAHVLAVAAAGAPREDGGKVVSFKPKRAAGRRAGAK